MIYYLKHDGLQEAYDLIKDLEPSTPQEYILKGIHVNTNITSHHVTSHGRGSAPKMMEMHKFVLNSAEAVDNNGSVFMDRALVFILQKCLKFVNRT